MATLGVLWIVGFVCWSSTWSLVEVVFRGRWLCRSGWLNLLGIIALAIDMEVLLLSCNLTLPFSGQSLLLLSSLRLHERIVCRLLPVIMTSMRVMLVLLGRDKGHRTLILQVLMLLPVLLLVPLLDLLDLSLLGVEVAGCSEWLELALLPWAVVGCRVEGLDGVGKQSFICIASLLKG